MIEVELRLVRYFDSDKEATFAFEEFQFPSELIQSYRVHFIDSFRLKPKAAEYKRVLSRRAYYFDGCWFHHVVSREVARVHWTRALHKKFAYALSHQSAVTEYRLQVQLSETAKVFVFCRTDNKYGIVFEKERDLKHLYDYRNVYRCLETHNRVPSLQFLKRKPVTHGVPPTTKYCFTAIKHDGVYGYVICYTTYLWEIWEDNQSRVVADTLFCPGLVFAAERMQDGHVILLDVLSVGNVATYRKKMYHILRDFLPSCRNTLPSHYSIQKYHRRLPKSKKKSALSDGIIYHTANDDIYKDKPLVTVELYYRNGFMYSTTQQYTFEANGLDLNDGHVYECEFINHYHVRILRERHDRFVCNSKTQIDSILCLISCKEL